MLILCAFSVAFHLTFQNGFAIISNEEIRDFSVRNGFEKESAKVKGNQVEILSDPVTVSREC